MLIESIIKRPKGTTVTLDDTTYFFKPDEQGLHVCEVKNKTHAAHLLKITEGFKAVDNLKKLKPVADNEPTGTTDNSPNPA